MKMKLLIGHYTEEEMESVLKADGYANWLEFDGSRYRGDSTAPYCLGASDVILYHLAGFMTILEKHPATEGDTRPIVLRGVTERLDEDNPLKAYVTRMKKYGRDLYIFAENRDAATQSLYLAMRGTIVFK